MHLNNQTSSMKTLSGFNIALLIASGVSEDDMTHSHRALISAGARTKVISMDKGLVSSWSAEGWGHNFASDAALNETLASDYDMLVVPGGQRAIDKLKETAHTPRFMKGFIEQGKAIAVFGEAEQLLALCGGTAYDSHVFTAAAELDIQDKVAGMIGHFENSVSLQKAA